MSFAAALEKVKCQVSYESFHNSGLVREICMNIAEMYVKKPDSITRINSEEIEAGIVQEIYRRLNSEHIELVIENYKKQSGIIRNKKAYLRTSLYNVVFELEAHFTNLVRADGVVPVGG
jgi:hypothetical protein